MAQCGVVVPLKLSEQNEEFIGTLLSIVNPLHRDGSFFIWSLSFVGWIGSSQVVAPAIVVL